MITYTKDASIAVSGKASTGNSKIYINDNQVTVTNKAFSQTVTLQEGLNLITVKMVPNPSGKSNSKLLKVVRTSIAPYLAVQAPLNGQVVNGTSITVSGVVGSTNPVKVTVNGVQATVSGGNFSSSPVNLVERNNSLTVIATDSNNLTTKVTLNVIRDTTNPVLANITPVDGANLNTNPVTVSGTVTDASPVSVIVNGIAASVTGGQFTVSVPVTEGANVLNIQAIDSAGNATSLPRNVLIDTMPPAAFTPTADPANWSNNNKPTICFSTTDNGSGIARLPRQFRMGSMQFKLKR